jgi:hypothetical protein
MVSQIRGSLQLKFAQSQGKWQASLRATRAQIWVLSDVAPACKNM